MKVNKSSWHYRAHRYIDWNIPTSLCGYFWKTVAIPFALLGIGLMYVLIGPVISGCQKVGEWHNNRRQVVYKREDEYIAANKKTFTMSFKEFVATYSGVLFFGFVSILFALSYTLFNFLISADPNASMGTLIAAPFLFSLIALVLFIGIPLSILEGDTFDEGPITRFVRRYKQDKEDDLVGAYLKTFKSKVCPLLEFVDR